MAEEREATKGGGELARQPEAGERRMQRAAPMHRVSPFEEMDRLFENFFPRSWLRPFRAEWPFGEMAAPQARMPNIDLVDREEDILLRAEIPGVAKEDLDVSVTDNAVTIKAIRPERAEEGDYYRHEITAGGFIRTVGLPVDVDSAKAKASCKDGILELTLPKAEQAKRRTVRVE